LQSVENMRKLMLVFGSILLLTGVIAEAMYIITNKVAYSGIVADAYLTGGILLILIGFILLLASVKIPKLHIP
jgi:hypothetical protein